MIKDLTAPLPKGRGVDMDEKSTDCVDYFNHLLVEETIQRTAETTMENNPVPPPNRIEYKMPLWAYFGPEDTFQEWLAESWWRKLLCLTKHDRKRNRPPA